MKELPDHDFNNDTYANRVEKEDNMSTEIGDHEN